MKKNIRINFILIGFILLAFGVKPSFASSRLTIPLASHATLVIENKNGVDTQTAAISDSLSSTKVILSSEGTTTSTPIYYPYGAEREALASSVNNRYYTGQRKVDTEDNLYNYNARYYSPETGIFTQPDFVEGPNRFAYVTGNPILHNDPTGHCVQCNVFWMQGVTGDHPWVARDQNENPYLHDFARFDAWTGIPSLLISIDGQENGLDTMIQDSKQFTSKSEAEASFMVNMGLAAVGGAEGLVGLEKMGGKAITTMGQSSSPMIESRTLTGLEDVSRGRFGGRYVSSGGDQSILIDPNDPYLQRFINDLDQYVRANRYDNTVSRPKLVEDFVGQRIRYSSQAQQSIYEQRGGTAYLGDFYNCQTGVCREMAALNHVGLASQGKESEMIVGNIRDGRHAWTEFTDTVTGRPMVADTAYIRPWNGSGVVPRDVAYQRYGGVSDIQRYVFAHPD